MSTTASSLRIRRAAERGHADHGWLDTWHSFSFASYHDPAHMGYRALRVINDDRIAPGRGFGMHPHRDMEIFSYVLDGHLQHEDSMGNGRVLGRGQVQLMSAGRGVQHSEFNPSAEETARLLQIWIHPRETGLTPGYTEWQPGPAEADAPKVLIISPDGREDSATIHQEVDIYRLRLAPGQSVTHELAPGRGVWVQIAEGALALNGETLREGDGASLETPGTLTLRAESATEALLMDFA